MLAYENRIAALGWLKQAFVFDEEVGMRILDPYGRLTHAQLKAGEVLLWSLHQHQSMKA